MEKDKRKLIIVKFSKDEEELFNKVKEEVKRKSKETGIKWSQNALIRYILKEHFNNI